MTQSFVIALFTGIVPIVMRWTFCYAFAFQLKSEQAAASFKSLFNSLPDSVLLLSEATQDNKVYSSVIVDQVNMLGNESKSIKVG